MNEMIEIVARSLCKAVGDNPDSLASPHRHLPTTNIGHAIVGRAEAVPLWTLYISTVRNAVSAMREPTPSMCQAALETLVRENKGIEYFPYQGWQAMIDEILK